MPLMIGLKGWKAQLKGESIDVNRFFPGWFRRLFMPRFVEGTTDEGDHPIILRRADIVVVELIPQTEIDAIKKREEEQKAAAEDARKKSPNPGRPPKVWTPSN